jgi:hypothetical protein
VESDDTEKEALVLDNVEFVFSTKAFISAV